MCGRYVNKITGEVVTSFFEVNHIRIQWHPRFNIAPTTIVPVVRRAEVGEKELVGMKWGLRPFWAKSDAKLPLMINARAETVASKPSYRAAFKARRCLVPASGYYEWQKHPDGPKQPFYFTRVDGNPIAFAGIWEGGEDDASGTVSIITTEPNADAAKIHDRMPVIMKRDRWAEWLSPEPLPSETTKDFLESPPVGLLSIYSVSTAVNSIRNDDPRLIEPLK